MSYLYVEWNNFGRGLLASGLAIRACRASPWPSPERRPATRRARAEVEGVAKDGLLGESSPSGYLANAAVCNICITSQLPVVCPGFGRNANGALEVPQDQFAVGGKNQVV
jgi:hypothetical protein